MAKLDKFLGGSTGYFVGNAEDTFPWDGTRGIWYSLLVCEEGKIEKYGFTSAKYQKENLRLALMEIDPNDDAILMGVWTGQYNTHLFILDIEIAIKKLESL